MRRDKNDIKWQECKKEVYKLDNCQCCLCKVMTVSEFLTQKQYVERRSLSINTSTIDPAHHLAVSQRPDLMYDVNNVYCLCRYHHDSLDNCRNPFNQDQITKEEVEQYWSRIIQTRQKPGNETVKIDSSFYEPL